MTFRDRKLAIELVVVMLLGSALFVPGGHIQFQQWYMQLIPFCVVLTDLDLVLVFSLYSTMFPCRVGNEGYFHQVCLLLLVGYVIVVGTGDTPRYFGQRKAFLAT